MKRTASGSDKSLGFRLAQARALKGLTQKQAADRVGLTDAAIAQYEMNKRRPDPETLAGLARLYGVSADYLLGLSDEPSPTPPSGTVRTAAAHAKPPPPGVDLAEWERRARQRLEELIEEVRRDWEETQRKGR